MFFVFKDDPDTLHFVESIRFEDWCGDIYVNGRKISWMTMETYKEVKVKLLTCMQYNVNVLHETVLLTDANILSEYGDPCGNSVKEFAGQEW